MIVPDKNAIKAQCQKELNERIAALNQVIRDVQTASNQETKSTAGDKHDTSRAQAQLEVERLGNQLKNLENMQQDLDRISTEPHTIVQQGSYVKTSCGDFYLAVALGKLTMEQDLFFAVSMLSPIGLLLKSKKAKDAFNMPNGSKCMVETVF